MYLHMAQLPCWYLRVCIYLSVHACLYEYTYTCLHVCMKYFGIYVCIHVSMRVLMRVFMNENMHVCTLATKSAGRQP